MQDREHLGRQWRRGKGAAFAPLAAPQQLGDLGEAAALDQLADRIAAIQQPAVGAVDLRELGLAGDDTLEAW